MDTTTDTAPAVKRRQACQAPAEPAAAAPAPPTVAFPLAALPDEPLALVLSHLPIADMLAASATCRGWYLRPERLELWRAAATAFRVELPGRSGRSTTRLAANLKRALCAGYVRRIKVSRLAAIGCSPPPSLRTCGGWRSQAERVLVERAAFAVWLKLHKAEAVGELRRTRARLAPVAFLPDIAIRSFSPPPPNSR